MARPTKMQKKKTRKSLPTLPLASTAQPWIATGTKVSSHHKYTVLWHGCTALDKDAIELYGINLSRCAVDTDFGQGFYTTTSERQAKNWARVRFFEWQSLHPTPTVVNYPVVMRFRVRRYTLSGTTLDYEKGLDELLSLQFVRGDYDNEEYWSLVQHCRKSVPATKKRKAVIHHHERPGTDWYQMVSGPVAAFWKQRSAMTQADQFSFHQGGTFILDSLIKKGTSGRGHPDYYHWSVV